ncbi:hypothetical protein BKA62DRAFT_801853 [Auriculariales sp. MPI-PUGE-AT-0066]|nr:hypothetical protein BKA62DRAFT_801853 [Auriculariales sp. MPI-PUGE-AT-0066]
MMASPSDTGPSAHSADLPLPKAAEALKTSIRALSASVEILLERKMTMPNTKKSMKQIVDSGDRIVTAVVASCQQLQPGHLPIVANSLIRVTHEMVDEWTRLMGDRAIEPPFKRFLLMLNTNAYLASFRDAIIVIETMFQIKNHIAQAILDPAECFNLRSAKPASEVGLLAFNLRRSCMQDLPRLSKGLAVYEGLKVVVQGMANMSDAADWPWTAIPQTILQFTSMIEHSLENQTKIQDLSDKICRRIALLLNICEKRGRSDDELERYVEEFLCDTQRIIIRLRIVKSVHPAKGFPLTMRITKIIEDEAMRMQTAQNDLELQFAVRTTFTVTSIAGGIAAVQATIKRTHEMVTETRDGVRALLEGRSVEATHHVNVLARLPGRPEVLNGRTRDLERYMALLCGADPARIVIIGPGGIGKTSLARALLYNKKLSPSSAIIASLFLWRLGLQHPTDPLSASISYLMSLPRVLLVIDNLETLWFSKDASAQAGTVQLFQRLKDITSLALVVTCRGGTTPDGIIWSNESSAELRPISLEAAHDTFVKLSWSPGTTAEEVSLNDLLQAVDCVPLAVTLLARLAKLPGKSPSSLLKQWHREHTKMMAKTSDRGREFNVEVSIQVSLDLLASTGTDAEAEQLLFVCALLPDGLRPEVFEQMTDSFKNISGAKDLLLTFALVSLGRDGELIMLSPVRHFVLSRYSATSTQAGRSSSSHLVALRKIYLRIAATAPQEPSEDFSSRVAAFAPEYGNLSSYLLHLIRSDEPSQDLVDAVSATANYSYWTNPSTPLLDALRPRLEGHTRWLARCLEGIGRVNIKLCKYALSAEPLIQAQDLYEELGDVDAQIGCKCMLGQSLHYSGRLEDAEQELLAAQALLSKSEGTRWKGLIHRDLGMIYFDRKDGQRLYAAQCSRQLGQIALQQGRLPAAELDIQFALSEFEALGEPLGAGQCLIHLGKIRYLQGNLESAATLLGRAEVTLALVGQHVILAYCLQWLGIVYRDQGRKKDVMEKFEAARIIYESIDSTYTRTCAQECSQEIAKLKA